MLECDLELSVKCYCLYIYTCIYCTYFVEQLKAYILLYIYRPKALVNLHMAQDFVEQLKAYILLYISSKSTRKSTHGTRLCGVAQGLHIAIYIMHS